MAFRVLNTNSSTGEIIGKRVRRYDVEGTLKLEQKYMATEKVADLVPTPALVDEEQAKKTADGSSSLRAPPAGEASETTEEDSTEEAEAPEEPVDPNAPPLIGDDGTGGPQPEVTPGQSIEGYDEDLDSSTTPRDLKKRTDVEDEDSDANEASSARGPAVEEHETLIKYKHTAGLSIGSFRNMSGFSIPGSTHNGFTAYYDQVLEKGIWYKGAAPHDSLSIEFGLGYYSRANFTGIFDNYDILPIRSEILYTLQFNSSFAFLTEVGAQFNWVISAENAVDEGLSKLGGIQPNLGVGILYNFGPQWYLRGDVGLDRIAIGLAVKW